MGEEGIKVDVYGRPKHIYSIWRKMQKKSLSFDELFDVRAVRIVVERLQDCYAALGIVHTHFRHLPDEFDDYVANRLEFVNGYATGRVLPPVMASATKAKWIREYAERENINLSESYAYSDSISDLPMLSIVGHPVAVNPDIRLKQTARQHDWAVLDLK